jgi:hypothetical protein
MVTAARGWEEVVSLREGVDRAPGCGHRQIGVGLDG